MPAKTQSENHSEKNKRKSTVKKSRREVLGLGDIWYNNRQQEQWEQREQDRIDFICSMISEIKKDENLLAIEQYCFEKGLHSRRLRHWAAKSEVFAEGKEFAKMGLGVRREIGWLKKQLNDKCVNTLWQFLDRYKEHDEREDKRKIALANEGVSEGQIKIITVNENVKVQEPE